MDELLQKVVEDISKNHRKIIDDWCKAYLAQIYEEGMDIKPSCFTLNQQDYRFENGYMGKRYWFTVGVPSYIDTDWISVEDTLPMDRTELLMTYNDIVMEGLFLRGKFYHPNICSHTEGYCSCHEQEGITHWMPLPLPPKVE